ncbi:hypothetical protein [Paenibacillus kribbensis]|nr:hypothetical protein [Paenibacillus kribbensis]
MSNDTFDDLLKSILDQHRKHGLMTINRTTFDVFKVIGKLFK